MIDLAQTIIKNKYRCTNCLNAVIKLAGNSLDYDFSYFYRTRSIKNVKVPFHIEEILGKDNEYNVPTLGDIMDTIMVKGEEITKIEIYIDEQLFYKRYFLKQKLVIFTVSEAGIILYNMCYANIIIKIKSKKTTGVFGKFLHLDASDRKNIAEAENNWCFYRPPYYKHSYMNDKLIFYTHGYCFMESFPTEIETEKQYCKLLNEIIYESMNYYSTKKCFMTNGFKQIFNESLREVSELI